MVSIIPTVWRTTDADDSRQRTEYFFEKGIEENESKFKKIGVSKETLENITKMVDVELKGLSNEITEATGDVGIPSKLVIKDWTEKMILPSSPGIFVTIDEPKALIIRVWNNVFIIISKELEKAKKVNEMIRLEFDRLNKTTKDFGLNLSEYLSGEEYCMDMINKINEKINTITIRSTKNSFEEEVIQTIKTFTNGIISNAEIQFKEPNESFEYDILLPTSRDHLFDIEVTDYETAKGKVHENIDTLKSQLILSTLDKAQRLHAESIIITKGFPEEVFNQMRELAGSRNITLLNEHNYADTLEKIVIEKFLERYDEFTQIFSKRSTRHTEIIRTRMTKAYALKL